jgi:hypothetical protein
MGRFLAKVGRLLLSACQLLVHVVIDAMVAAADPVLAVVAAVVATVAPQVRIT